MANTVSILSYANTFSDWLVKTNALAVENNNLAANNYIKSTGTLYLNEPTLGVIAQEVESVLPEVISTRESGYKGVRYEKIIPLLIQAIKEQQDQIDELKKQLDEQQKNNEVYERAKYLRSSNLDDNLYK